MMALRETDIRTGLYTPGFFVAFGARVLSFARKNGYPVSVLAVAVEPEGRGGDMEELEKASVVLRALGEEIRERAGDDSVIARISDNQIAALLPHMTYAEALELADSIRTSSATKPGSSSQSGRKVAQKRGTESAIAVGVASTEDGAVEISDLLRASQESLESERVSA